MTSPLQTMIADDFVWQAITYHLPSRRRRNNTGLQINCPMCVSRGEKNPDRKLRCGIANDPQGIMIHCFNCHFACRWRPGEVISRNMREFLMHLGMSEHDTKLLNYKAQQYRRLYETSPEAMALLPESYIPYFEPRMLPKGSKTIEKWAEEGCTEPDFIASVEYLFSRGDDIANAMQYYWSPDPKFSRRIIIPFRHEGVTVGYTGRAVDKEAQPRYVTDSQPNFLFNARALSHPARKYVILVEGVFDAIALDAVGMLGSHLNNQQIAWIKSFDKQVILLPDRDRNGNAMIDIAMQNKWLVSFPVFKDSMPRVRPWWDKEVGDAAKACELYGRIWTLLSVIESANNNPVQINYFRQKYY